MHGDLGANGSSRSGCWCTLRRGILFVLVQYEQVQELCVSEAECEVVDVGKVPKESLPGQVVQKSIKSLVSLVSRPSPSLRVGIVFQILLQMRVWVKMSS